MSTVAWLLVAVLALAFGLLVWELVAWIDRIQDRNYQRRYYGRRSDGDQR